MATSPQQQIVLITWLRGCLWVGYKIRIISWTNNLKILIIWQRKWNKSI